jgi:CBS-domain-containing membrane protein
MSRPVIAVAPQTPLDVVAALLEKHRIKRVPVLKDGKLVGIVSRANLVQALARHGSATTAPVAVKDSTLRTVENIPTAL